MKICCLLWWLVSVVRITYQIWSTFLKIIKILCFIELPQVIIGKVIWRVSKKLDQYRHRFATGGTTLPNLQLNLQHFRQKMCLEQGLYRKDVAQLRTYLLIKYTCIQIICLKPHHYHHPTDVDESAQYLKLMQKIYTLCFFRGVTNGLTNVSYERHSLST